MKTKIALARRRSFAPSPGEAILLAFVPVDSIIRFNLRVGLCRTAYNEILLAVCAFAEPIHGESRHQYCNWNNVTKLHCYVLHNSCTVVNSMLRAAVPDMKFNCRSVFAISQFLVNLVTIGPTYVG